MEDADKMSERTRSGQSAQSGVIHSYWAHERASEQPKRLFEKRVLIEEKLAPDRMRPLRSVSVSAGKLSEVRFTVRKSTGRLFA